jgi:hypothetical protein
MDCGNQTRHPHLTCAALLSSLPLIDSRSQILSFNSSMGS